jgi:uncharacterized protein (DUF1330 family)
MAAYVITYLEVTDPDAFQVYRKAAGPTFAPYGGKPIVVDGQLEVLEGMTQPRSIVVVEFENMEQARRWYASRSTRGPSPCASERRTRASSSWRGCPRGEAGAGQHVAVRLAGSVRAARTSDPPCKDTLALDTPGTPRSSLRWPSIYTGLDSWACDHRGYPEPCESTSMSTKGSILAEELC